MLFGKKETDKFGACVLTLKRNRKNLLLSKRSQGVIEFAIIFGFVLFFFIVFFTIIQGNIQEKNKEKERIIAQNIALDFQDEINLAAKSSNGYSRTFELPENILGKDYEINASGDRLSFVMEGFGASYKIAIFMGSINKGQNIVRKENGSVYLN